MALMYRARQSSIESKDQTKKWHPCLVKSTKMVTLSDMSKEIAEKSSLTPGDVKNTIDNLVTVMKRHLMNSQSVRLDDLGSFTVVATSKGNGVDTFEEVSSTQIKSLRIRFTPTYTRTTFDGTTRTMFTGIHFERIDTRFMSSPDDNNNEGEGDGEDDFIDPTT